ncbi:MAG: hypothetical protein HYU52_10000 [Acidobacteria bacterium]|nr:hypothetical protein [Acidobacteriota bacterium]
MRQAALAASPFRGGKYLRASLDGHGWSDDAPAEAIEGWPPGIRGHE